MNRKREDSVARERAGGGKIETYDRMTLMGRRWFWRCRASNGQIVASGEPYSSAAARDHGIETARAAIIYGRRVGL